MHPNSRVYVWFLKYTRVWCVMYDMIAVGAIVSGIVAYLLVRRYQEG